MKTATESVLEICGGPKAVAAMLGVDLSWVYRWTYPKESGGTGGLIPAKYQSRLLEEARKRDLPLRPEHFFARHD